MAGTVCVGIDAGGTLVRVLAIGDDDHILLQEELPGANPQRHGIEATAAALSVAINTVVDSISAADRIVVCAGVAGAGRTADADRIRQLCLERLPAEIPIRLAVVHDGIVALEGAFSGESGAIVIAGTGSLILARTSGGEIERAGGWGYLIGDEGSGYALGAAGIRAVAAQIDGGAESVLTAMVAEAHGIDSRDALINAVYRDALPLQALAPLVLAAAEDGDEIAQGILKSEVRTLASQLFDLSRIRPDVQPRIALFGGLIRNHLYRTSLSEAIGSQLPSWLVVEPRESPVHGALRLARKSAVSR